MGSRHTPTTTPERGIYATPPTADNRNGSAQHHRLHNTANGVQALYANTTGSHNTANGIQALYANTTGSYNTANGAATIHRGWRNRQSNQQQLSV